MDQRPSSHTITGARMNSTQAPPIMRKQGPAYSSPVRRVDPWVRAMNTFMYGLVVHFGSLWIMGDAAEECTGGPPLDAPEQTNGLLVLLFVHEYWVYLQHANVLANPLCQRLDRQYGIALLRSNQHWAIAGTLSAYWCRESLGMFLCLPFLAQKSNSGSWATTPSLVVYSLLYHTIKSRGVRQDALRRYSPTFGIMRVVIDKFYLHTASETILSLVRFCLQGLDTLVHFSILQDLLGGWESTHTPRLRPLMHVVFAIWVTHAALNQLFRCSTASVMVQAWHSLTARGRTQDPVGADVPAVTADPQSPALATSDDDTVAESISSAETEDNHGTDQFFVVRKLLRQGRVADELKGRQGTASDGVDTAVRIETVVAILAGVFMIGLGDVPFRYLATDQAFSPWSGMDHQRLLQTVQYAWFLWSLLYGLWAFFLKRAPLGQERQASSKRMALQRSIVNIMDLGMLITSANYLQPLSKWFVLALAAIVTSKSFLQASKIPRPKFLWITMIAVEFTGKTILTRWISTASDDADVALVASLLSLAWALWVISNSIRTPCEVSSKCTLRESQAADVVFLGHPAELSDCWALWLLPYSLNERWQRPLWAVPLWPLHYLVGWYTCNYRQRLFGDQASFFCCDDVYYGGTRMQTWTAAHFGRHFVTNPRQVKQNIEAAARHAERTGVKVLCLGALNKAESINGGGVGVVQALGPSRNLSVIHGNHLTAAAVVETTYQAFGNKAKVFLTGASSKVGWAVAQALRDRHGYQIMCHSTDKGRRQYFEEQGFSAASKLAEGTTYSHFWIVGKYDRAVAKLIPQNATAVVFSVPHPLENRTDVRVIEAGTLRIDMSRLDRPRRFTNKLKDHEVFACHAASVVANYRLKKDSFARIDETGPVDPNTMDSWLKDAKRLGFYIPHIDPAVCVPFIPIERPPVVIVGAGPAGLAVAACLSRRQIRTILLEGQAAPDSFGSWAHHFSGLEVTSQKKWCNLPGFAMSDHEFPGEHVTATDYQRYLQLYAARYGVAIHRGVQVESVEKGTNAESTPWRVLCQIENERTEIEASAVVVATGKHRLPQRNTSDDLASRLTASQIPFYHSTDLRDEATWRQAIQSAQDGRLCMVGMGNSAADLATAILKHCPNDGQAKIHVATRTVPPIFPRQRKFLRVDTLGYLVRWMPHALQEGVIRLLWWGIPSSRECNAAFPGHLPRWNKIRGRVPVIDKYGAVAAALQSGRMVGHGPIVDISSSDRRLSFQDEPHARDTTPRVPVDLVILATGYQQDCLITREDRLNGLYKCGFGNDRLLPLRSIGEEAQRIATEITSDWNVSD